VVRSVAVKAAQAASSRVAKSVLSNLRAQNSTTPWELGQQWLTGNGPRHQEFRGGDPFTELYRLHGHTKSAVAWAQSVTSDGSFKIGHEYSWDYDLSGLDGVPKYVGDYSTLTTGGRTGNLAYTFLGSHTLSPTPLYTVANGGVVWEFVVENESDIESATHPPVIGYTDWWTQGVGGPL